MLWKLDSQGDVLDLELGDRVNRVNAPRGYRPAWPGGLGLDAPA